MASTRTDEILTTSEKELVALLLKETKIGKSPFIKPRENFSAEKKYELNDEQQHHRVNVCNKNPKQSSSEQRNKNDWLIISNDTVIPKTKNRHDVLNVLLGEIHRFELGDKTSPKYRILEEKDGNTSVVSKKVKDTVAFYDYYENVIRKKNNDMQPSNSNDFIEGALRSALVRWFFQESDGNADNFHVISENIGNVITTRMVSLDYDRSLWTVLNKFHTEQGGDKVVADLPRGYIQKSNPTISDLKFYKENRDKGQGLFVVPILTADGQPTSFYFVPGEKSNYMGTLALNDFISFPNIGYQLPKLWIFNQSDYSCYFKILNSESSAQIEKYFSALKIIITPLMKKYLIEYHLDNQEDKAEVDRLISRRLADFSDILKTCDGFKTYIKHYMIDLVLIILYEQHEFFFENKHYLPKNQESWESIWETLSNATMARFHDLFITLGMKYYSIQEVIYLRKFSSNCDKAPEKILPTMVTLYENHSMKYPALCIKQKLAAGLTATGQNEEKTIPAQAAKLSSNSSSLFNKKVDKPTDISAHDVVSTVYAIS